MNILTYTTVYPNSARPLHGLFVEQRLRKLVESGRVHARVVAPVPWFPFTAGCFGKYAEFARAPKAAVRHGIDIVYPRYPLVPKVGQNLAPFLMAAGSSGAVERIVRGAGTVDLVDAHFLYPDGVAAAMLARRLGKPLVMTARGTDVSLMPQFTVPRRLIVRAAEQAAAVITVCQALKDSLLELGVDGRKVFVLRNGVDMQRFQPADRDTWRTRLKLDGFTLLSVGEFTPRKSHDLTIRALAELPGVRLLLIGQGAEEAALRRLARDTRLEERVTFLGPIPQDELKYYYSAADAMVLSSSREGLANVLLESMACGTPVVASRVWGSPEVVNSRNGGVLMDERTPAGIARAVERLRGDYPPRADVRRHAEQFSWDATTRGQLELFSAIIR